MRGRVSEEDDNASKLICEEVIPFDMTKKEGKITTTKGKNCFKASDGK